MRFRLLAVAILVGWSQTGVWAQEGREHVIPLFMAADNDRGRQGFLRIINHSNKDGTVQISGIDDTGRPVGPVQLRIGARKTVHINSDDVENGNESKQLSPGLLDGTGDWRLKLYSADLDIEPLAYIRTKSGSPGEGFLTSMHDVATEAGMRHFVPIFNPGSNPNQQSSLRIINVGDSTANITITGRDDDGVAGADSLNQEIPVRGAFSVTAMALEEHLGDGKGKWSLTVSSDQPVQVMSLMDVPTGQLSNLSGARRGYRGATGLWQISFEGGITEGGYLLLLPDNRFYAWLPEDMNVTRIARGLYGSNAGMVSGEGVVYESGLIELDGLTPTGGSEEVDITAEYRGGDWIRGEYEVAGELARSFHGWAYTGFERGGLVTDIKGTWTPIGDDPDLPAIFVTNENGEFNDELMVDAGGAIGELNCDFSARLDAVNPAFNAFHANPEIDCGLISFGGAGQEEEVDMIMSVMDSIEMPGMGTHAIVFAILPGEGTEIALGSLYELTR